MSVKKRKQDALKAKEKKQKIIAGVGGVLLVGLLAFQGPRVMKQLNRSSSGPPPPPAAVTTTPGTTPSLAAPTTMQDPSTAASSGTGASASSGSGSSAGLITSSTGGATSGELASFSRFESKDPFAQQVQDNGGSTGTSSSSSSSSPSSGSGSSGSGTSVGTGGSTGSGSTGGGGSQPAPGTAVISVNGTLMSVTVGSDFPQPTTSDPNATALFHLVSLTNTTAKIAIAGGSYTSGAHTVTLHVNKAVTLMNTADGSRFKLILKPQGTAVPGDAGSTSTTPTVTLPAATP